MDKDSELRGWKAHCVYLQDKCERLELENSRLKASIDEANAQEPLGEVYKCSNTGTGVDVVFYSSIPDGETKLYARPIPAQQSVEQAHMAGQADAGVDPSYSNAHSYAISTQQSQCNSGTNEYGLDIGYMAVKLNVFLRDISRHKPSEAARVLARLALVADDSIFSEPEFAQQSQAVAISKKETTTLITEQDAREIAQSAVEYYSDHGWRDGDKFWMQNKGLSLLNKLNESKNHGN